MVGMGMTVRGLLGVVRSELSHGHLCSPNFTHRVRVRWSRRRMRGVIVHVEWLGLRAMHPQRLHELGLSRVHGILPSRYLGRREIHI